MNKTQRAVKIFDDNAQLYQEKYMDTWQYHSSFDRFCELVKKPNAKVLDLACGPGNIAQYFLSKRPDFQLLGTDLSPKMIALAKENNPTAEFELMDCKDVGRMKQSFDGIVCGFGLPYLSREEAIQLIEDTTKVLNSNGILYLSTMEDDYSKSRWQGPSSGEGEKLFMHYHQADYLEAALKSNGFVILYQERVPIPQSEGEFPRDLILIAQQP